MIPYYRVPPLDLGFIILSPFLLAIIAGALVMHYRFLRRLTRLGLDSALGARMSVVITTCTLVGAHFFDAAYEPISQWWNLWNGLSALGATIGFALGWIAFSIASRLRFPVALALFDAAAYATALGAAVMRLGCAAVHDHPGAISSSPLAIAFPEAPRWDLGLLEALFWFAMAALFRWLDRAPRRPGFYPALVLIVYPLFRLLIDPLRVDQTYYAGLSVDAWVAAVAIPSGAWFAWLSQRPQRPAPEHVPKP
ncbi:MAG: prolipoprotein diacylglyceryl transferase family protein [Bryobacteraceae bacterium]